MNEVFPGLIYGESVQTVCRSCVEAKQRRFIVEIPTFVYPLFSIHQLHPCLSLNISAQIIQGLLCFTSGNRHVYNTLKT